MRKPIVAGNWKMHKTVKEAIELANNLKRQLYECVDVDIVICPPFTVLNEVSEVIYESNIQLGAQDLHWEEKGAFTGEVSAPMLKDVGCKFVIVGHSERRQKFGETNQTVNRKLKSAIKEGLIPIMCLGEDLQQRESGKTLEVVKDQVEGGLQGITGEEVLNMVIAYEPVWAIGTGKNATPKEAQEGQFFIRQLVEKLYNRDVSSQLRIQYGGSVRPDNIGELIAQQDIDGALVGGASLEEDSFVQIVKRCLPF